MKSFFAKVAIPGIFLGHYQWGIPDPIHDFSNFPPGLYSAQWRKEFAPGGAGTKKQKVGELGGDWNFSMVKLFATIFLGIHKSTCI